MAQRLVLLSLFAFALVVRPAQAATVVSVGTASISNEPDAGTWTIGSAGTSLTLNLDSSHDFAIVRLTTSSGVPWALRSLPDSVIKVGAQSVPFGNRAAGFVYQNATASVKGTMVQLDATFDLPAARLRVTRHYAAASGSPTFETWTTFGPLSGTVTVSDLDALRLSVPVGAVRWLNGLQGDDPNNPRDSMFTLQKSTLNVGERLALGAEGRSSEQTVPWIAIDGERDEFYAGLLWSGAWSLAAHRTNGTIELALGLPDMSTAISAPIDGPRAFFGVTRGALAQSTIAMRTFIVQGVRGGRGFEPLVTYNTWFAYGTAIDERSMRAEIDGAANLGAELFVLDAGWYVGAGREGASDFLSGLGSWRVDSGRFPNGLRAMSDYAHERGLKFGLWVEPERVAQSTIGQRGLAQESWLAKSDSRFGSADGAQLCFASAAAREWVLDQLTELIDSVAPDYLKWDNNFWVNCDRSGHGHGATDGNFAHVNGLYEVLESLRARYPSLLIENVSGGGNRLDVGMLRYSDVGWMDDRTAPSAHVRHNLQGLSVLFPPAYLLSFVMDHPAERIHGASDFPLYFRSRMTGVLGLCFRTAEFSEGDLEQMAREIEIYQIIRQTLARSPARLLSEQAAEDGGPPWDVFQLTGFGGRPTIVSAFQSDEGVSETTVKPLGLRSQSTYEVRSVDSGVLGTATGAELMRDGVLVRESPRTAAHVLVFTIREP